MKKCYPEMDASEVRPFAFPDVKMYQEVLFKEYLSY